MAGKKPSRARERQLLLDAALQVRLPKTCDVAVIGGGASGLVAAITAAEAGASTVVFERATTCGKPILATGNGRCNFSNVKLDTRHFNNPGFVDAVCGPHWLDDILAFFRESGLRWSLEDDRLYPVSRQAASVRNVLLARAQSAGVTLASAREVTDLAITKGAAQPFRLAFCEPRGTKDALLYCAAKTIILATGGVVPSFANAANLCAVPLQPVLCPLACLPSPLSALDGRRAQVRAFLTKAGSFFPCWNERGEVLFRDYGISGIVTFNLSRRAEKGDLVELDLAPDLSRSDVQQLVDPFAHGSFTAGCLDGVLDPSIAHLLEELALQRWHLNWPEREVPTSPSEALITLTKALPFCVEGPAEVRQAQVMRGGLAVDQFDPHTLAARACPGMFACGEALDIDADCGGFNLSWAWKSGMVAGASAAHAAITQEEHA